LLEGEPAIRHQPLQRTILAFETAAGITVEMVNAATLLTLSNWEPDRPVTFPHYFKDQRFAA
jgi:PhoPQ-activated pathogenicity-related protein